MSHHVRVISSASDPVTLQCVGITVAMEILSDGNISKESLVLNDSHCLQIHKKKKIYFIPPIPSLKGGHLMSELALFLHTELGVWN